MLPPPPRHDTLVATDSMTHPTVVKVQEAVSISPDLLPTIPGYDVLDRLGQGGMGRVFKARHQVLRRLDAIKMLNVGASQHSISRFMEEARAIARLKHAHIAQVYDSGEVNGQPFYAMELVEAGTLAQKLNRQPQEARWSARLVMTLAQAVHYFHEQGVIHRDLKPSNVLMTVEGEPKIADFGLVKNVGTTSQQTETGDIIGTPSYMSPEQATGQVKNIGPASDIYALGAILYECLTGRPPFQTPEGMQTLMLVITADPVPASQLVPKLPKDLDTICMKCLEKQPSRRYETAQALSEDLQRFLKGEPIIARPVGRVEKAWKWCRRRPAWAALIALGLVSLIGFGAGYLQLQYAYSELNKAKTESDLQFQATRGVLDRMILRYSDDLAGIPQTESIRQKGLEDAQRMYERLLKNKPYDETGRANYVEACVQLAGIERSLGSYDKAERVYQQAMDVLDQLRRETTSLDHSCRYLTVLLARANLQHDQGKQGAGLVYLQQAEPIVEKLKQSELRTADQVKALGNYYATLGQNYRMAQQHQQAEEAYRHAVGYHARSLELSSHDDSGREGLALARNNLGTSLLVQNKLRQAAEEFQQAIELLPRMSHPKMNNQLAMLYSNQAIAFDGLKMMKEADAAYAKASELFKKLMVDFPMIPEYRFRWCRSRVNLIRSLLPRDSQRVPGVIDEVDPVLVQLVKDYPQQPIYRAEWKQLENCKAILADLQQEAGKRKSP